MLGFGVPDLQKFFEEMSATGVAFTMPPAEQDFGGLALFVDSEGGRIPVSAAWPLALACGFAARLVRFLSPRSMRHPLPRRACRMTIPESQRSNSGS
jgi:hypothetical protein